MKQKKVYGFKKAAIAHENGMTTSATPGLILPIPEIQVNLLILSINLGILVKSASSSSRHSVWVIAKTKPHIIYY